MSDIHQATTESESDFPAGVQDVQKTCWSSGQQLHGLFIYRLQNLQFFKNMSTFFAEDSEVIDIDKHASFMPGGSRYTLLEMMVWIVRKVHAFSFKRRGS